MTKMEIMTAKCLHLRIVMIFLCLLLLILIQLIVYCALNTNHR